MSERLRWRRSDNSEPFAERSHAWIIDRIDAVLGKKPKRGSAAPTGGAPGGVPPSITPAEADAIIDTPTVPYEDVIANGPPGTAAPAGPPPPPPNPTAVYDALRARRGNTGEPETEGTRLFDAVPVPFQQQQSLAERMAKARAKKAKVEEQRYRQEKVENRIDEQVWKISGGRYDEDSPTDNKGVLDVVHEDKSFTSVYRNQTDKERQLFGSPFEPKPKKLLKDIKKAERRAEEAASEYVQYVDWDTREVLPGVNINDAIRAGKGFNRAKREYDAAVDTYNSAVETPRSLKKRDRNQLAIDASKESYKIAQKEKPGLNNPWKDSTGKYKEDVKILRRLAANDALGDKTKPTEDRSVGDFLEEIPEAAEELVTEVFGGLGGTSVGPVTAGGGKADVSTPKVVPSPVRDRLRPEWEEDAPALQPLDPAAELQDYKSSVKKLGYDFAALDSESPVDQALTAMGIVGGATALLRTGASGARALKAGNAAANIAKDANKSKALQILAAKDAIEKATKTGKIIRKRRAFMNKPLLDKNQPVQGSLIKAWKGENFNPSVLDASRYVRRGAVVGFPAGYEAVSDNQFTDLAGAFIDADKSETVETTARGFLNMFAVPLSLGLATGVAGRNLAGAGRLGNNDESFSEAVSPLSELIEQYGTGLKDYYDTFMHGSPEEMKATVENEAGYLPLLGGAALTGAAFRGVGGPMLRAGLYKIPTWSDRNNPTPRTWGHKLDDALDTYKFTVKEAREGQAAEGYQEAALGPINEAAAKLNDGRFESTFAGFHEEARRAESDGHWGDDDTSRRTPIQIIDAIVYSMVKGRGDRLTKTDIKNILSDPELSPDSSERALARATAALPEEVWDENTAIGAHAKVIRDKVKDLQDVLTTEMEVGTGGLRPALQLEALVARQQMQRGAAERARAAGETPEEVQPIPQVPKDAEETRRRQALSKVEADLAQERKVGKETVKQAQQRAREAQRKLREGSTNNETREEVRREATRDIKHIQNTLKDLPKGDPRITRLESQLRNARARLRANQPLSEADIKSLREQVARGARAKGDYEKRIKQLKARRDRLAAKVTPEQEAEVERQLGISEERPLDRDRGKGGFNEQQEENNLSEQQVAARNEAKQKIIWLQNEIENLEVNRRASILDVDDSEIADLRDRLDAEELKVKEIDDYERALKTKRNRMRDDAEPEVHTTSGPPPRKSLKSDGDKRRQRRKEQVRIARERIGELKQERRDIDLELVDLQGDNRAATRIKKDEKAQRVGEIDAELRQLENILAVDELATRRKIMLAAVHQENLERARSEFRKEAQEEWDAAWDRAVEDGFQESIFQEWRPAPQHDPAQKLSKDMDIGYNAGLRNRRVDPALAQAGLVDRSFHSIAKSVEAAIQRKKNQRLRASLKRDFMYERENEISGMKQHEFLLEEIAMLPLDEQRQIWRDYEMAPVSVIDDPSKNNWRSLVNDEGEMDKIVVERLTAAEVAKDQAKKLGIKTSEPIVLIKKGAAKYMRETTKELANWQRHLEAVGRWQAKVTLGTNVGWLITQPMAEMLHLLASHPNPNAAFRAYKYRKAMIEHDKEAHQLLQYAASTTLGTNVLTTRLMKDHDAVGRMARHYNESYEGQLVKRIAQLETLGELDRKKGAFIRELGTLMELESNMTKLGRTAKAIRGEVDAIEKIAPELAKRSPADQLRYMFSERGLEDAKQLTDSIRDALDAGDLLTKKVDRQMGNWTAVMPGWEANLSSVMFFYPFTRFSIKWTLQTFPKDHPAWYAVWTALGSVHGAMIEEIMGGEPPFFTGWAQVPIFDKEGNAVALWPVARAMGTSNAAYESFAQMESPADLMGPVVPFARIALDTVYGVDQYGNKLEGSEPGSNPGLFTRLFGALDRAASLSPMYREFRRLGVYSEPLDKQLLAPRSRQVGDDPDERRSFFRRQFGPMADLVYGLVTGQAPGIPTDAVRAGVRYNWMFNKYIEAGQKVSEETPDALAEARDKEYNWRMRLNSEDAEKAHWVPLIKDLEDRYNDSHIKVVTAKVAWAREQEKYRKWKRNNKDWQAYERLQADKDAARLAQETLAYALDKEAKMSGLKGAPIDAKLIQAGREAYKNTIKEFPERELNARGQWVIKGSPASDDPESLKDGYWAKTVPAGGRAWSRLGENVMNLGWERLDGSIKKPGDELERQLLDPFAEMGPSVKKDVLFDFVDRYKWKEQSKKARAILKEPIPKEREEDRELRRKLERKGAALLRKGQMKNDPEMIAEGRAMSRKADDLQAEFNARVQRREQAKADLIEARGHLRAIGAAVSQDDDGTLLNAQGEPVMSGGGRPNLSGVLPGSLKVSRKRAVAQANHILDLKEKMMMAGDPKALTKAAIPESGQTYGLAPGRITDEQAELMTQILSIGDSMGATPKMMLAAVETAIIESGISNPTVATDHDSLGWRQERQIYYDNPTNVEASAKRFFEEAMAADNESLTPGLLAQATQQSAYPDKYDAVEHQAAPILAAYEASKKKNPAKKRVEAKFWEAVRKGKAMGIYDKPEKSMMVPVHPGEGKGKGDWMGGELILHRELKPWEDIQTSWKREYDTVDGAGMSDHYVGNTGAYAIDIGTSGAEGDKIAVEVHKRLGLIEPYTTGYGRYTSRKYPGFSFQILWKTDGDHYDHVHVGVANEDATQVSVGPMSVMAAVRARRYPSNADLSAAITGGAISGGGGAVSPAGGGGTSGGGAGTPNMDTLQGMRDAYNLGAGGFIGGGGDLKVSELPFLAEIFAQTQGASDVKTGPALKKPKVPVSRAKQLGL